MRREVREKNARKKLRETTREVKRRAKRPTLGAIAIPEDVLTGQARLTALGSGRVLVENHTGIARLERECVRVRTKAGALEIEGKNLVLSEARAGALYVTGEIQTISLPRERGDGDA